MTDVTTSLTPVPPNSISPPPASYPTIAIPTNIDYTSKDFAGLAYSMLTYASSIMPDWNPASEGDFGMALLESFAYEGDILSYYGDRITQEAYLPTATQRLSLLNIAQLLGYVVHNGAPATGTVTFTTSDPGVAVSIPAGTQVTGAFSTATDSQVIYETTEEVTCPDNGGTVTVPVSQGVTYTTVAIGTSSGLAGQVFSLAQTGVINGTVQVFVQSVQGTTQWTFSQYLVDNGPDDAVFTTYVDASGTTWVQFGDNVNGMIPGTGLLIYATYIVGAGSAGNVGSGVINTVVTPIVGVSIALLGDGVTPNTSSMSGGADPETADSIRSNAPQSFQTQFRAVSPADFENLVYNVPGITAANAVSIHSTSVTLYVLGPSYQVPGASLINNILNYFAGRQLAGVSLSVATPTLVPIDVGSVGTPCTLVVQPTYLQYTVQQAVTTALTNLFQPPNSSFAQFITVGDVYQTIMAVAGVDYVIVPVITREDVTQTGTTPIQLRQSEIAVPGAIYINYSGGQ
jgi:hypothetical protein